MFIIMGTSIGADEICEPTEWCYNMLLVTAKLEKSKSNDKKSANKVLYVEQMNDLEMVERQGYPIEQHTNIQTEDGYLLDIHRIPHGTNNGNETNKPVVFLMHGLLCSSVDWVNMGTEKALAYILADAGYDVWMGNARGNTWSRKHITYNPNRDSEFWKFSWHEIGAYDLPAMIDYVLGVTGEQQVFYIGHSQGTTSFFVMGSVRPEYNAKIKLAIALAPIGYMSNMTNPFFQLLALFHNTLEWITSFLGIDEFLPSSGLYELIGQAACSDEALFQGVCSSVIFLICGWNSEQLNASMLPVIMSNAPAGAATRQLVHYAQGIRSGKFRQYDHGFISNLAQYGSLTPPDYKTDDISAPVALFYSTNDWLAAVVDVHQLANELPNLAINYLVPLPKFNHLDFIFAIDVKTLLYDRVLAEMENYL
ncbi:lysosomal acid lipase-related [Holotrichia oblita]|uniref:Lysosomal acid lipase-related n=1 Tax=Holotrichia oblita TaxID=644536 RepID=A0ACB9TW11_HOLOL|nr:lysosomal acid lipase-related [Holotrichia oblita]